MNEKFLTISVILFWSIQVAFGQSFCGTDKVFNNLSINKADYNQYQRSLKQLASNNELMNRDNVYIIPVVFHIIHKGGIENVPDEQVYDQIRIINEDFRKLSAKVDDIIPEFQSIAADCKIEFRLAKYDPEGNCTNGIVRYFDEKTYASTLHNADSLKLGRQWPREKYLNIYVLGSIETSGGGTTLGFAYYPITVDDDKQELDGIMQVYSSVGSFGTSSDRYSGVLTHEIGHYLHLHHTWGQNTAGIESACNEDDEVDDTPNTKGNPSVCNLSQESCGSLDNVQNFMDYSFCYAMLTEGQRVRMTAVLNDTIAERNNLWSEENLIATGASDLVLGELCAVDFDVKEDHICVGDTFTLFDKSYHFITNWQWNSTGTPNFINDDASEVLLTFNTPGSYDVNLAVNNDSSSLSLTKENLLFVHANPGDINSTYSENFNTINQLSDLIWDGNINGVLGFAKSNIGRGDSGSVVVNNFDAGNAKTHILETTTFNFDNETDLQLMLDVAFATKTTPCLDKLSVWVTNNCGLNWFKVKEFDYLKLRTSGGVSAIPFVPNNNQWKTIIVDLPDNYNSETTRFKFEYYTLNGNNFYFDNFQIRVNPNASIVEKEKNSSNWMHQNTNWISNSISEIDFVHVYDLQGRVIFSAQGNTIDNSHFSPGIYIIRWQEGSTIKQQKVIKH